MNLGSLATQRFDAVILDLDNTLVDSQQALLTAFGTWAREYAIPADQLIGRTGWRTRDIVDATIDEHRRAGAPPRPSPHSTRSPRWPPPHGVRWPWPG